MHHINLKTILFMLLVFIASSCTETTSQNIVRHNPKPNRGAMPYISDNSQYAAPGRRLALVIGNGAYNVMPDFLQKLKNPVNDAVDITKALQGIYIVPTLCMGTFNLERRSVQDAFPRRAWERSQYFLRL
ncbi:hypothetical protein TI05_07215 [Achromatium sp. WMS3]|nr:hypothetical protein TI05_07215 [Achromatium sp. WMS3]